MALKEQIEFITGPQLPIGFSWFDTTLVTKAKQHGEACPAAPPTDAGSSAFNDFVLLHYYDLALCEYIAHVKTNDPVFLTYARKAADSWWKHPDIGQGTVQRWPDSVSPVPRHAGVLGMICRAIDGRPEMFPWLTAYTQFHLDHWLKKRISSPTLFYGLREGAFTLDFAVCLAKVHPDAGIRAQLTADVENVAQNYYGRLQQADGSWRWDDFDYTDADGGTLKEITQPFMVGLLLRALANVHRLSTNATVKENVKNQILKAARNLYEAGLYRKDEVVTGWPEKKWRSFWYFYYGGTTVNPTKYAQGGGSYVNTSEGQWVVKSERQSIGPIVAAYGYAFSISGDATFKAMGDELWSAAFGGEDGIRNEMDGTAKNFNQNVRWAASYPAYVQGSAPTVPIPAPIPIPTLTKYVYEQRTWPSSSPSRLKLLNDMGQLGWRCSQVISSTVYFEKVQQ